MSAFTIPSIFTAIDKFSVPVRKMGNNLDAFAAKAEADAARVERKLRNISNTSFDVAKKSFLVGAAIATPLVLAVNEASKYETALASLSSITGATGKQFDLFKSKVEEVSKDTKRGPIEVAKAFELAGSAMPELLNNADALSAVSKASIVLSKASKDDLENSIRSLTGVMNQFSYGADQSEKTINILAAGAKVGAASIVQTSEAMVNFGSVAASANLSLEQTVGAIQVMSKFSLFGAEAGTKLRGSVLKLQQAGLGYASGQFNMNDALDDANKKMNKLSTAKQKDALLNRLFGAENISTGKILLNNTSLLKEYTKGVTATDEANIQASINQNTMSERLKAAQAQIQMLSIKIGEKLLPVINRLLDKIIPVIDNIVSWTQKNPGLTKTIVLFAAGLATLAFAISAIAGIIGLVTKAQMIWNAAMLMNPIGLIIAAVAAAIVLITLIIAKWNEWGAVLSIFIGPLGLIIGLIQAFRRNWEMIANAFKNDGILGGLKAIGATLLDVILMPLQQVFKLLSKLPSFLGGGLAADAMKGIESFRTKIGVNTTTAENGDVLPGKEVINPKVVQQDALVEKLEATNNAKVDINIKDKNNRTEASSNNDFVSIKTTSTQ